MKCIKCKSEMKIIETTRVYPMKGTMKRVKIAHCLKCPYWREVLS